MVRKKKKIDKNSDYWRRAWDNIKNDYLEVTAVTSIAKGLHKGSQYRPFGVGKSTFALKISYVLHYWSLYGYGLIHEVDKENREVWKLVLKHMTYNKRELIQWASGYDRIPALIWDDVQATAPSVQSVPELDKYLASYLTTSRTSLANIIMTMPSLDSISKPFRQIVNYEAIVFDRGVYELHFIKTRKKFRDPYRNWRRMWILEDGHFTQPPEWVYREYSQWRENERRRVMIYYAKKKERFNEELALPHIQGDTQ